MAERYETEVQNLQRVLQEAISEAPDRSIHDKAVETETINTHLVFQQRIALALARKGDTRQPAAILSSPNTPMLRSITRRK